MVKSYELGVSPHPPSYSSKETLDTVGSTRELTDKERDEASKERGHWGNRAEFLLSCVGLSVGLGNVWRFPTLAFNNGGAAFLIPYIILQLLIGKPMYFMELIMGQFSGLGPTAVWRMNPAGKGIGVAMLLISLIVAIYYNVVMAYTLYYFFASMQSVLPWTACTEDWLKRNCSLLTGSSDSASVMMKCSEPAAQNYTMPCRCSSNITSDFNSGHPCFDSSLEYADLLKNATKNESCAIGFQLCTITKTPAEFYFYEDVIKLSPGLSEMGDPIWYLALCLLLSWMVVVLCLIKGVKSSGKVVYFTATFPYLILIVLLIGGAIQDGALQGVKYFLIPDWEKLLDINVWKAAAGQMFFSLSVSFGGIIMFGSYNRFRHNVYIDALIISTMDIVTSFIAGLVIFTTLGAMSYESGLPIEDVAKAGYGLAFVAYPEALSRLPVPHLWSLLFFFMLFTLGLDSEFALLETVLTCLQDEIPKLRKKKWLLCITCGIICYFLALPLVTPGGDWALTLMDSYGASFSVLLVAFCEVVSIGWVYRVDRFMSDVKYTIGYYPHPHWYWMFCWAFSAPLLILAIFILSMYFYTPPLYSKDPDVPYEDWAQAIGWVLSAVVLVPIPLWFVIAVFQQSGTFTEKLIKANSPAPDWRPQPHDNNTWVSPHHPRSGAYRRNEPHVNAAYDSSKF